MIIYKFLLINLSRTELIIEVSNIMNSYIEKFNDKKAEVRDLILEENNTSIEAWFLRRRND